MESKGASYSKVFFAVLAAAALWFYMFSPWTAGLTNFWLTMSCAAVILTGLTVGLTEDRRELFSISWPVARRVKSLAFHILAGALIAFLLWGVFWIGDKLSALLFDFARPQVDSVYSMKDGFPAWAIAVLLLLVIGPAEELFWRGFVQRSLHRRLGPWGAFVLTAAVYALVHIWSFNFMLVMAALVAGAVWSLLYRLEPRLLPSLVVSHALWDALVFVIFPI